MLINGATAKGVLKGGKRGRKNGSRRTQRASLHIKDNERTKRRGIQGLSVSKSNVHNHNNNHNTRIENNSVDLIKVMEKGKGSRERRGKGPYGRGMWRDEEQQRERRGKGEGKTSELEMMIRGCKKKKSRERVEGVLPLLESFSLYTYTGACKPRLTNCSQELQGAQRRLIHKTNASFDSINFACLKRPGGVIYNLVK